jgi:hypothetical protein
MFQNSIALLLLLAFSVDAIAAEPAPPREAAANVMLELTFTAVSEYKDPFNDVTLDVIFTDPDGKEFRVPAFWAGGAMWKARYASPVVGIHRFRSENSETKDKGLHGVSGNLTIKPYTGKNPLYLHGPVRVAASNRYFEHADGTPFLWLGDTWWMGLCHRLRWPEDVKKLAEDRKAKGFNVIQIVAGLYPDMHPFDPRGANEAGFPWRENYAGIRPEYFDAADQRILYLVDQGFTPCIVGAWGYFIQWMGPEKAKQHWRDLIARYGALPVVWCAAGEANLPWYLAKGFPYDDRKQVSSWTEVLRYIRATDPFRRPLTIQPTGIGRLSARNATDDVALLDFDMLQTPHGQREAVGPTLRTMRESYADTPVMPVINGEPAYEMLGDSLPTKWTRRMFWICMTNGAAGHTYGANGIWQVNRQGQPYGPSPHHAPGSNGYGKIPWDQAMNLPGSSQVSAGKKLFEQYQWQQFRPQPQWVRYVAQPAAASLDAAKWIWFPEGKPAQDAPAEKRYLRRRFEVPPNKKIASGILLATADDSLSVRLNGKTIGSSANWQSPARFDLTSSLTEGKHALAIVVENVKSNAPANPAGFICVLHIRFADGESLTITSDANWRSSRTEAQGWEEANFDDSNWPPAMVLGDYGMAPWGKLADTAQEMPYATGDASGPRIIYVPNPKVVEIRELDANAIYNAFYFDPVSGKKTAMGEMKSQANGTWICPPPKVVAEEDWVVILEPVTR